MTAGDPRTPTPDVLDELAFVLHGQGCGEVCVCVDDARALLPTVERIAYLRAAEEVRTVRQWLIETGRADADTLRQLRDRVDQIAAEAPTPDGLAKCPRCYPFDRKAAS